MPVLLCPSASSAVDKTKMNVRNIMLNMLTHTGPTDPRGGGGLMCDWQHWASTGGPALRPVTSRMPRWPA